MIPHVGFITEILRSAEKFLASPFFQKSDQMPEFKKEFFFFI